MNERVVGMRDRWQSKAGRVAAMVACAGLLWAAGCGEDPDAVAVSEASIKLASLSAGSGAPLPEATATAGYREVISMLQGVESADAALLVSVAQRGLGTRESGQVLHLEQAMLARMPVVRAALESWHSHSSAAAAAAAYDPAAEFRRIDGDVRTRQDEAEAQRKIKASIEAEVAELLGKVTTRLTEASKLRAEAGELRLQMPRVSETEGLALAERIRELSRKADALELEASGLKTQADYRGVDLHSAEVTIAKLESQVELLTKSRAAVQTRQASQQARAAQARGDAQTAAALIAQLMDTATGPVSPAMTDLVQNAAPGFESSVEEIFADGPAALTPFVTETFEPKVDAAASQLRTAASTAGRARGERRDAASLATAQAQQGLGDVQWAHARGMDAYAQLLEELASATPALPSSAEYASRAAAARESANEAKLAAFEAYSAAKDAYGSSGASGEAREKMDALVAELNSVMQKVGKGVADADALRALEEDQAEEGGFEPTDDEPMDEGQPAAGGDAVEELRAAIAAAIDAEASGDFETAISFLHPATDADAPIVEDLASATRAMGRLNTATEDAFGERFSDWLADATDPMLAGIAMMFQADNLDPDSFDIRVQGDEAVALTGLPMMPEITYRRIDGQWKQLIEMAEDPMASQMLEMVGKIGGVFADAADGVESGELTSNAAVGTAVRDGIMAAAGGG